MAISVSRCAFQRFFINLYKEMQEYYKIKLNQNEFANQNAGSDCVYRSIYIYISRTQVHFKSAAPAEQFTVKSSTISPLLNIFL